MLIITNENQATLNLPQGFWLRSGVYVNRVRKSSYTYVLTGEVEDAPV